MYTSSLTLAVSESEVSVGRLTPPSVLDDVSYSYISGGIRVYELQPSCVNVGSGTTNLE